MEGVILQACLLCTALQDYSFPLGDKRDVKKKLTDLVVAAIEASREAEAQAAAEATAADGSDGQDDDGANEEVGMRMALRR